MTRGSDARASEGGESPWPSRPRVRLIKAVYERPTYTGFGFRSTKNR